MKNWYNELQFLDLYDPGQLSNFELKLTNFHAVFLTYFQCKSEGFFGLKYSFSHILTLINIPSGQKHPKVIEIGLKGTLVELRSNLYI